MTTSAVPHHEPLIGGERRSISADTFPAVDATTGETLATITRGGAAEIDAAVSAARAAFPSWSGTTPAERSKLLARLAEHIEQNLMHLAEIDSRDIGRIMFETPLDHSIAARQFRFFAGAITTHDGWTTNVPGGWSISKREPLGVVGQIIPWNVPAIMVALKLAPALAAGNTVVLKPDENASLSTLELCDALADIFPPGVVNVVPGFGEEAGAALVAHPDLAKLAFTGSSQVGRLVAHAGAERLIPVSLELGGKSPNIVFPDIDDMDRVIDNAAFAGLYCNGQSCLAGTRLFVHDDIYDEFLAKLVAAFEAVRVGLPLDADTRLGPLVSQTQGTRVAEYLEVGKSEANLVTGGVQVKVEGGEHGWFFEPTIFEAHNKTRIAQEEIFGPVLTVLRWKDYDEMIDQANDIGYGLASGIYTSNLANAMRTADRLHAGSVWVNQYVNLADGVPFGGYRGSGLGREYCKETLDMYTQLKSVVLTSEVPSAFYV